MLKLIIEKGLYKFTVYEMFIKRQNILYTIVLE